VVDWNGDAIAVWLAVKRRDGIATQFDPDIPLQSAQLFLQAMKKVFGTAYFTQ
jgi:hypothetical protein